MRRLALLCWLSLLSSGTGACRPHEPAVPPAVPQPASSPAADLRARGLVALDAGQFHVAREAFAGALSAAPDNLATRVLLDAATRALLISQTAAADAFADIRPTALPAPPAEAAVVREAPVTARGGAPRLVQLHVDAGPRPDDATWLRAHTTDWPELEVPNPMRGEPGNLPPHVSPLWGTHVLVWATARPPHTVLCYGPDYRGGTAIAVLGAAGERLAFFDLAAFGRPATWAEVADGVLLVTLGDDDSAYVAALELATGALLWRSDPAVASPANFVVHGAHLLTARTGGVFVLDRRTGRKITSHPISGSPLYLRVQGRRLAVRSDAADHEFELK